MGILVVILILLLIVSVVINVMLTKYCKYIVHGSWKVYTITTIVSSNVNSIINTLKKLMETPAIGMSDPIVELYSTLKDLRSLMKSYKDYVEELYPEIEEPQEEEELFRVQDVDEELIEEQRFRQQRQKSLTRMNKINEKLQQLDSTTLNRIVTGKHNE